MYDSSIVLNVTHLFNVLCLHSKETDLVISMLYIIYFLIRNTQDYIVLIFVKKQFNIFFYNLLQTHEAVVA